MCAGGRREDFPFGRLGVYFLTCLFVCLFAVFASGLGAEVEGGVFAHTQTDRWTAYCTLRVHIRCWFLKSLTFLLRDNAPFLVLVTEHVSSGY